MAWLIENDIPGVLYNGLNSAKSGTLSGNLTLSGTNTHSGTTTFSGTTTLPSGVLISTIKVLVGAGAPSATAAVGSLYLNSSSTQATTRMYINTDGGTTWAAFTAGS